MADEPVEYIDIKEFRERGYLQELNRCFLHPLGLALEVSIDDETGEERLGCVWDYRADPEGIFYAGSDGKPGYPDPALAIGRAAAIAEERTSKVVARTEMFKDWTVISVGGVQPLPREPGDG